MRTTPKKTTAHTRGRGTEVENGREGGGWSGTGAHEDEDDEEDDDGEVKAKKRKILNRIKPKNYFHFIK